MKDSSPQQSHNGASPFGNRTVLALMARGIDDRVAARLSSCGETIASLTQKSDAKLRKLDLSREEIEKIRSRGRPPIPADVLSKLLYRNRFACCVCREPNLPIIVHHIVPWEKTHNHDILNLVVLCLVHHGEAHTIHDLSRNLDKPTLREFKRRWEAEAKKKDAETLVRVSSSEGARWDYINHQRLFEVARHLQVSFKNLQYFDVVRLAGFIDEFGLPKDPKSWGCDARDSFYMYNFGGVIQLYAYMKEVADAVVSRLKIDDITNHLSRTELAEVKPGAFISVQGAHTFKALTEGHRGKGQLTRGMRRANGVEVSFQFDAWECTSSTSRSLRLTGHKVATSVGRVNSLSGDKKLLRISTSVLLIGSYFESVHTREYGNLSSWESVGAQRMREVDETEFDELNE